MHLNFSLVQRPPSGPILPDFKTSAHTLLQLHFLFASIPELSPPTAPPGSGQDALLFVTYLNGTVVSGLPHIYSPVRILWLSQTLLVFLLLSSWVSLSIFGMALCTCDFCVLSSPILTPALPACHYFIPILWVRKLRHTCGLMPMVA